MMALTLCPHKRLRSTVIFLEPAALREYAVAVLSSIICRDCDQIFEFQGATQISADRQELRALITEKTPERLV